MNTEISDGLSNYDDNIRCDQACKRVLSNKRILAWIMKACVDEFKDCTVDDIAEKYIEGEPEISGTPIHRDGASSIRGMNTDDVSKSEHTVLYDIKFSAVAPDESGTVGLIINVEAQNKYHTGYPLTKRAMYYIARLISSQFATEFEGDRYNNLKKVYSIWICMSTPRDRENTLNAYRIVEEHLIGNFSEKPKNYDLMKIVMFHLDAQYELGDSLDNPSDTESKAESLRMLNVLFSQNVKLGDRKEILNDEFGVAMTGSFEEEVDHMCNLSQGFYERGIGIGEARGIDRGIGIGEARKQLENIMSVMKKLHLNFDEAANLLDVPNADRDKYRLLLSSN